MTYQDILDKIQASHISNLESIDRYMNANEPYEQDFKTLVQWVVANFEESYTYAPSWCYNFSDAGTFAGFLSTLHHAMIDDGEVCFVNVESMHPFIVFMDHSEPDMIRKYLDTVELINVKNGAQKHFRPNSPPLQDSFISHRDVNRFIADSAQYNADMKAMYERFERTGRRKSKKDT